MQTTIVESSMEDSVDNRLLRNTDSHPETDFLEKVTIDEQLMKELQDFEQQENKLAATIL
jgi:hypothetical protein